MDDCVVFFRNTVFVHKKIKIMSKKMIENVVFSCTHVCLFYINDTHAFIGSMNDIHRLLQSCLRLLYSENSLHFVNHWKGVLLREKCSRWWKVLIQLREIFPLNTDKNWEIVLILQYKLFTLFVIDKEVWVV